jgi:flagella basal body P-ring formation protein FlgA
MQMLCHKALARLAARHQWSCVCRAALLGVLVVLGLGAAMAQAPADPPLTQETLLKEVGAWMQQTQQLSPGQFDFAPLDSRVKVQPCDRPLVMDLPFATRETVRVRCLGASSWQLYLRAIIKNPAPKQATAPANPVPAIAANLPPPAPAAAANPPAVAPASPNPAPVARRKVVVGTQLLRAGTVLSAALLQETEQAATGLDNSAVTSIKDVENAEVVRDIPAGTPLRSYDVRRAILVKQGQLVMLTIGQGSGFAIVARVEALQDGRMGDQIRLKNPESGRLLSGVVTGPNAAKGL